MSSLRLVHRRSLTRKALFFDQLIEREYYYIQDHLDTDEPAKPLELEPLYHFVQSGPPWQHIYVAIQIKDGKLVSFDAMIICEIDHQPDLDARILAYIAEKMEREPQFMLLETLEQQKFHEKMKSLPAKVQRCQELAVDETLAEDS